MSLIIIIIPAVDAAAGNEKALGRSSE